MTYYYAGGRNLPGTNMPANVMGNCPHRHRTPEAAGDCIVQTTKDVKAANGPSAYCDRIVMVQPDDGDAAPWTDDQDPIGPAYAAALLGVTRATVDQWRQRGIFPEPSWPVAQTGRPQWKRQVILDWAAETGRLTL